MTTEFILYAAIYRLAIIGCGLASIIMGYRLFVMGVMPREGSDIDAQAGEIRLTIKNAAPGTVFALFGVVLIGLMVFQGNPQAKIALAQGSSENQFEVELRGGTTQSLIESAHLLAEVKDWDAAIEAYAAVFNADGMTLRKAAIPLIGIADIYRQQKRVLESIAYGRLAAQFDGGSEKALLNLVRSLCVAKKRQDAQEILKNIDILIEEISECSVD